MVGLSECVEESVWVMDGRAGAVSAIILKLVKA